MTRSGTATEPNEAEQRRVDLRNGVIALLVAIVLLLLALLIMAFGVPEWNADGSRESYPAWVRALICASVVAATVTFPLGLRSLVLALLPSKALGLALAVLVGVVGLISAPLELWLVLALTDAEEPGTEARRDEMDDWDWD